MENRRFILGGMAISFVLCVVNGLAADDRPRALTPLGAEIDGNRDGTIPPWTGGITSPPKGYKRGDHHPDPYPEDKILFAINGVNLDAYKDKLSRGQIALLKRYPSFTTNVYPTRRSASLPQRIYDCIAANGKTAKLINNGNVVTGAVGGSPFPVPQNGQEAIWNHILRYRGDAVSQINNHAAVTVKGDCTLIKTVDEHLFSYNKGGPAPRNEHTRLFYFLQFFNASPAVAGTVYLLHEPLDMVSERRSA